MMPVRAMSTFLLLGVATTVKSQCVGNCEMSSSLQQVIDTQCSLCQHLSESECRRHDPLVHCDQVDNCNATIHGSCTWSTFHGCRPVDATSPFLTIVEESQFYDQITNLIIAGQNCTSGQSQASCEAAGCLWAPRTPEEIYNAGLFPFSHEPCQAYDSALVDLLAIPFSLTGTGNTATNVQIWHQRANRCRARSVSNCMQISDLSWTAGSTSADFPCVVSDRNDVEFCDLSMEGLLWALGADAVQDNTVLQSAMEGRVHCSAINGFLDSDRCPAGQNCSALCNATAWCSMEYDECKFIDDQVATEATRNLTDPITEWHNAETHCQSMNCSKAVCEQTLGGICSYENRSEEWGPGRGECELATELWMIDTAAAQRTPASWVKPFARALFGDCEDYETQSECSSALHSYTSGTSMCAWAPQINGSGSGECVANFDAAFVPAIPESSCGGGLADMVHSMTGCSANLNQADCTSGAHSGSYACEWNCGLCTPSMSLARSYDSSEALPAIAYAPSAGECDCVAVTCPSRPDHSGSTAHCQHLNNRTTTTAGPGGSTATASLGSSTTTAGGSTTTASLERSTSTASLRGSTISTGPGGSTTPVVVGPGVSTTANPGLIVSDPTTDSDDGSNSTVIIVVVVVAVLVLVGVAVAALFIRRAKKDVSHPQMPEFSAPQTVNNPEYEGAFPPVDEEEI